MDRLTMEEIVTAWNGAVPESKDKGIEMYLHLMQAVADAQYRKCVQSLSQEAVRDEVLEEILDRRCTNPKPVGDSACDCCQHHWFAILGHTPIEEYRALKREPNAAAQASGAWKQCAECGAPTKCCRLQSCQLAAPDVQQPLQPVDPNRVHAGWNIKGEPVYLDEPLAPDVASMVKRLHEICAEMNVVDMHGAALRKRSRWSDSLDDIAALLAKLGRQVETLQAAHDLGWAHKTCPNCGADMMAGASDE